MKIYYSIIALLFFFSTSINAQFQDDFSDGDFTNNPSWYGDDSQFEINSSNYLRLASTGTDTSILVTESSIIRDTEWKFWVKQSFNSSSNNHSRIYLASDISNLKGSLEGYFVQIGGTADNVSLWRQDGLNLTEIITGTIANTGNSTNRISIKVICDADGNWQLYSDDLGGTNYLLEGITTDVTYSNCDYFGIFCKYTSSNATKFYFNDFLVGSIQYDTVPPEIVDIEVLNGNKLRLKYNEVVEFNSSEDVNNYSVNNGIGKPSTANRLNSDSSIVELYFNSGFGYNQNYSLTVSGIKDNNGNEMDNTILPFLWYNIKQGDIVINEIMADPAPEVGLPSAEYIELYNKSGLKVNLENWILKIGTSDKVLPSAEILPDSFIIITHENNENLLSAYGPVLALPSFSLKNSGTSLLLKTNSNEIMHYVDYNLNWYKDDVKVDGGWSLEQIDPNSYCLGIENWAASTSLLGGSPGSKNSIDKTNEDNTAANIDKVVVISSYNIMVFFDKAMDSTLAMNTNLYTISHTIGNPSQIAASYPDYRSFTLTLSMPLQLGVIYNLKIDKSLKTCGGNTNNTNLTADFGIPETPDSSDVLINEVLFNPRDNGVDYVEIYNNSEKIIDFKYLRLANWSYEDNNYENVKKISKEGFQIFPYQFYVLSTSNSMIRKQYYVENTSNLVEVESMPSMSNSEGNIYLITSSLRTIDAMNYDEEMHYALLNNPDGISLERINYEVSSFDKSNWHSSAIPGKNAEGFGGTPTYINSQNSEMIVNESQWETSPEIFSPNNDGFDDFLQISYSLSDVGYTASISIFDSKGRLVRRLIDNEILELQGQIIWDGINDNGNKANIGIYIIYIEIVNLKGNVEHHKLSTVIGG
jgi:hypothetical protein